MNQRATVNTFLNFETSKVVKPPITIPLVKLVLLGVVPFNLIKGIVIGGLSTLLVPKLRKVLTVAR